MMHSKYINLVQPFCTVVLLLMAVLSIYGVTSICIQTMSSGAASPFESVALSFIALSSSAVVYGAMTAFLIAVITGPIEVIARQEANLAQAVAVAIMHYIILLANSFRLLGIDSICRNADIARTLAVCTGVADHFKRNLRFQSSHILAPHWVPGTSPRITYH